MSIDNKQHENIYNNSNDIEKEIIYIILQLQENKEISCLKSIQFKIKSDRYTK